MVTRRRLSGGAVKVPFGVGRGRFGGFLVDFGRFEVGEPCKTRKYNPSAILPDSPDFALP